MPYSSVNLYVQDESRFGLFTRNGRALTAKGVKPICTYQHKFENTYLFGAFSPINGDSLLLEMPYCNSACFQVFLNEMSSQNPSEFKVVLLDNGAFHKARILVIPPNIALIFLPPYSPELNPAEQVWQCLKSKLVNKTFKTLNELKNYLAGIVNQTISNEFIKGLCKREFLLAAF